MQVDPEKDGLLSRILWITSGVMLAMLASIWSMLRETPPDVEIPRRVFITSVVGGIVSGVFVMALLIHLYGWTYPWAILVVSIPAGFGAPLVMAAATNAIVTALKAVAKTIGKG